MVDNEADSVKVSESAEPPLCIFKVYIITIMGHLNKDTLFFWGAGNFPGHSPQGLHLPPRETVSLAKVPFSIVHPALVRFLLLSPFSFS